MRILADENFPKPLVDLLREQNHDVVWARTDCIGWKDTDILERAESESRIVLTLDKDFCQISLQRRAPLKSSGVVLFRAHPSTPDRLRPLLLAFLRADQVWTGHLTTVTATGLQLLAYR